MAANKYVSNSAGKLKEVIPAVVSAGGADANKIVALDATGRLDTSVMPVGISAEVLSVVSSENLAAGDFVNIYSNAGTLNVRKADNTTNGKPANGFVLAAVTSPAAATIYQISQANTQLSSLTVGSDYFLGTSGGVTTTAPSATGNLVQQLGRANSATSIVFVNFSTIEIA